jgi:hypothetical protein
VAGSNAVNFGEVTEGEVQRNKRIHDNIHSRIEALKANAKRELRRRKIQEKMKTDKLGRKQNNHSHILMTQITLRNGYTGSFMEKKLCILKKKILKGKPNCQERLNVTPILTNMVRTSVLLKMKMRQKRTGGMKNRF